MLGQERIDAANQFQALRVIRPRFIQGGVQSLLEIDNNTGIGFGETLQAKWPQKKNYQETYYQN